MFDLSFSRKNAMWGGLSFFFIFFVGGVVLSLFAAGFIAFSMLLNALFQKIHNNIVVIAIMLVCFALVASYFHGPYLATCIVSSFGALLLSAGVIYLLTCDMIIALWCTVILLLGCSFLPLHLYCYVHLAWFAGIGLVSWLKLEDLKIKICELYYYVQSSITKFDLLIFFIILLSSLFLAVSSGEYFWGLDVHHPIYELSIGQSYQKALLNVPDLSYSGKFLRYHFLGTQLPLYFSNLFNISLLDSLYTVLIAWLIFLSFFLILSFFYYYNELKTPLFFIFFMPSFIFLFECLFRATVIFTPSFFLAFILMTCGLHFLIRQWYWLLLWCSFMLLMVKASFFMVLVGGIFLYWLRQEGLSLKFIAKILPYPIFFLSMHHLFLSGAHGHNLWVLMPSFMFHYARAAYFFCRAEAVLGILVLVSAFYVLKKETTQSVQAIAAIIISGLGGWLLLAELTEGNSYQFIRAMYFPFSVFLWYITYTQFPRIQLKNASEYTLCVKMFLQQGWVVCLSLMSVYLATFYLFQPFSLAVNVMRNKKFSYSQRLIQAYSWLGNNVDQKSIILFGLHYDGSYGFIRSALSGKQMYCEGFKAKGILMEKDYPLRKANITQFYKHCVQSNNTSNEHETSAFSDMPGIPLSQSPSQSIRLLHYLSLGKEWHYLNRLKQVNFEFKSHLNEPFDEEIALNFIRQAGITHVILEHGDRPSAFLNKISREMYNNNECSIFQVNV